MAAIKKTTTASLRLAPETLTLWRGSAESAGLSLSDWLREKVDATEITWHPTPSTGREQRNIVFADPTLMRELGRIGKNLNQVARGINTSRKIGRPVDLAQAVIELCCMEQQISLVLAALPQSPSLTRSAEAVARSKARSAAKRAAKLKKLQAIKNHAD